MIDWNAEYASGSWDRLRSEYGTYALIAGILRHYNNRNHVLDVGCGEGLAADYIAAKFYTGVDGSAVAIARASRRASPKERYFVRCDIDVWQPSIAFDAMIFCEMLYYLPDYKATLARYTKWLAPDGIIIIAWSEAKRAGVIPSDFELLRAFTCFDEIAGKSNYIAAYRRRR